jgi:hypothetical protein
MDDDDKGFRASRVILGARQIGVCVTYLRRPRRLGDVFPGANSANRQRIRVVSRRMVFRKAKCTEKKSAWVDGPGVNEQVEVPSVLALGAMVFSPTA